MKPIIILIAVAIAGAGLGVGFLNAPSIDVVAQDVGIGHTTLQSPISTAFVGFHITAVKGNEGFFKNLYDACIFKADQDLASGSTIFCKLTDMSNKVVAEGKTVLVNPLPQGAKVTISPLTKITAGSLKITNIADVTIVVQGP